MSSRILSWIGFFSLWLLFTWSFSLDEVATGALAAGLATAGFWTAQSAGIARLRARMRPLRTLSWLAVRVPGDTVIVLAALGRRLLGRGRLEGGFRAVSFAVGGEGPEDAARRAAATEVISLTPNTYVVSADRKEESLLLHQLVVRRAPVSDRRWLS